MSGPCPFRAQELETRVERFLALGDARRGHGLRHPQAFVWACSTVAVLMGAGGYPSIEDTGRKFTQRQLRALPGRSNRAGLYTPPSDTTIRRVRVKLDTAQFDPIVGRWLLEQEISAVARLAIDGKTLRGSGRPDGKPLQWLSAVPHRLRLRLAQIPIEEKSHEIPALPELLRSLPKILEKALVTAEAMPGQQASTGVVTPELGGDD